MCVWNTPEHSGKIETTALLIVNNDIRLATLLFLLLYFTVLDLLLSNLSFRLQKIFPPHIVRSNNMSVVGVDLGTLNTVIAVARNRGVDVVSFSFLHLFSIPKA